jgi:hypothetical protein
MARTSYGIPKTYAGAWTVDTWLQSTPYPSTAHRGAPNGTTRSEFSWNAYDNAIAAGFVSLELSAHRTSDGVWVLNHDATTGAQYQVDSAIATTSWPTLQNYARKYGVMTEPMRRLDETLGRYANYVLFIENKSYANFTEFFALTDAADTTRTRIVMKFSGDSTSTFAACKARGYTTWGYFFGTAGASTLPTEWDTNMDWVGLSSGPTNNATDQVWFDWCHERDIPIKGHIVRQQADWDSMKSQGVQMAMVNNDTLLSNIK